MRLPRILARHAAVGVMAPSVAALLMVACSSAEDVHARVDVGVGDAAETKPDGGGVSNETVADAGEDAAADAGELPPPPPYDFAVKCAGTPCVTRIAARGGAHACAVLQDGAVSCWGANVSGQLGTGSSDAGTMPAYVAKPRRVMGVSNATGVAATGEGTSGTTCVVSGPGDVACFGSDASGQLGRSAGGSTAPFPEPAPVDGLQATSVTLSNTFALAIGTDSRLWSWGKNDVFQLARDMSGPDVVPASASAAAHADRVSSNVRSCAGTSRTGFAVSDQGDLVSWGGGAFDQIGRPVSLARDPLPAAVALSDVESIATGTAHACALSRGRVHCWGENQHGQLGTMRRAEELLPARALLPPTAYAVAVAAGGDSTCAIVSEGDVYCWGANDSGQGGASAGGDQPTPSRKDGLTEEAVAVAIMDRSMCVLLRGGSVVCWGGNLHGQLGRGARDAEHHLEPATVPFE